MKPEFRDAAVGDDAVRHIAARLTLAQRRVLANAVASNSEGAERPVVSGANEHTVQNLKRGPAPLVTQDGAVRYLTRLGRAVGHFLRDDADVPPPGRPDFRSAD